MTTKRWGVDFDPGRLALLDLRLWKPGVRDHGATADSGGPSAIGDEYWPRVARLLRDSYRSLATTLKPVRA